MGSLASGRVSHNPPTESALNIPKSVGPMKNGSGVAKRPTFSKDALFCKFIFRARPLFALLKDFCAKSFKSDSCDTRRAKINENRKILLQLYSQASYIMTELTPLYT